MYMYLHVDITLNIASMSKLMVQEWSVNTHIALTLVSFMAYSKSAWHFDPPTQQALIWYILLRTNQLKYLISRSIIIHSHT